MSVSCLHQHPGDGDCVHPTPGKVKLVNLLEMNWNTSFAFIFLFFQLTLPTKNAI